MKPAETPALSGAIATAGFIKEEGLLLLPTPI